MASESVVVAPFNIYIARLPNNGCLPRFPSLTDPDPTAINAFDQHDRGRNVPALPWKLLGSEGNRIMNEDGITMNRSASDGFFTSYGGGRKVKQWTINESLSFEMNFADSTLETMALIIEDGQDVGRRGPGNSTDGVVIAAETTTDGTNFAVGDYVALKPTAGNAQGTTTSGTGAVLRVSGGTAVKPEFEVVRGGSGYGVSGLTVSGTAITKTGNDAFGNIVITLTTTNLPAPGNQRELVIGRRGGRLAKTEFAFLFRGAASPYIGGARAHVEVPRACFSGDRGITMNRANPISFNAMVDCNEVGVLPYSNDTASRQGPLAVDPDYANAGITDGSVNDPTLGGYARILAVAA